MGNRIVIAMALVIGLSTFGQFSVSSDIYSDIGSSPVNPMRSNTTILGDWNVSTNEVYENATIYLDGNLTVLASGNLTLVNSTLMMNLTEDGEHWIKVQGEFFMADLDGNPLTEDDASRMCSNESGFRYGFDAVSGSILDLRNSLVTDCGYNSAYKGIKVNTQDAIFDGMDFYQNYYGLYVREDGAVIRNCTFDDNYMGAEFYMADYVFENNVVSNSTYHGLYASYCDPTIRDSQFLSNDGDGIYLRYADAILESCEISDSGGWGVNVYSGSPLIVNSTLANSNDLKAVTDSFPRLLNTALNESNVNIGYGLHVSVGQFVDIFVKNITGSPMENITVSILDEEGNPASHGITDAFGRVRDLCFRERFLTETAPIEFDAHRVIAFSNESGTIWHGENSTTLSKSGFCEVIIYENPADVLIWPDFKVITAQELYVNTLIIATGDVFVDWGGNLSMTESEIVFLSDQSLPMGLSCAIGTLTMLDSQVYSIGTAGHLNPGRIYLHVQTGCTVNLENVSFRWTTSVEIMSDFTYMDGIFINHAEGCGIVLLDCNPVIENICVEWAENGVNLAAAQGVVSNVSLAYVRDYGLYSAMSASTVTNLTVSGASKGIYVVSSDLELSDINVQSSPYGVHSVYSDLYLKNSTIQSAGTYGIYSNEGTLKISDCEVLDGSTGLRLEDSEGLYWIDSCYIGNNSIGVVADGCNPVILNSTLSNPVDISVKRATTVAVVNSTLNTSNLSVNPSGFVDIGSWIYVNVFNQSLAPVNNSKVSVLDSSGEVSSSGITDASGSTGPLAFREERILWNRTENHSMHELIAFKTENITLARLYETALMPGETVNLTLWPGGSGWIEWTSDRLISSNESYTNKTIVAEGNIEVYNGAILNLNGTTLWTFNMGDVPLEVCAVEGGLNAYNTTLAPISSKAPLQSMSPILTYEENGFGSISGSTLSNFRRLVTYSDEVNITESQIMLFDKYGIQVEGSAPTIENVSISLCNDGIYLKSGAATIKNATIIENGRYGVYAISGAPNFYDVKLSHNEYGLRLDDGADAFMNGCRAAYNKHGYYITGSSPFIKNSYAESNTNNGIYVSNSYAIITGSEISGNSYGIYCANSAPEIRDSAITSNNYGVYIYLSGPLIDNCQIDKNTYGIYDASDANDLELDVFSSGRDEEVATFVDGGSHTGYGINIPKRAILKSANLNIRGIELRNEAVREDPELQFSPSIHGDWLVWQDKKDGDWEIYAYNLSVDSDGNGVPNYMETPQLENDPALFRITNDPGIQLSPKIWKDTIVWTDMRCCNDFDIYAYSFSNDTEWAVTDDLVTQQRPDIYGDYVVWCDNRNVNTDIFMKNINTGKESQLSTSDWGDYVPQIDKNKVVWYSYSGSPGGSEYSDVYMYDIDKGELSRITGDDPLQYTPSIYGDSIVWHDNRHGNWEIYHYDIVSGLEERITDEAEQSFVPQMNEDRIVYYYHDRVKDFWSVRMYDRKTGVQTDIERETNGDSHPVIYGDRIAWVNKTTGIYDIYVLDLSIVGEPHNVTLDIGNDDDFEFEWSGLFDSEEFVNSTLLLDELKSFLPGIEGGTIDIPINISSDTTGRVGLDSLSIVYDIPTFVVGSKVSNSTSAGAYCYNSEPWFINSTFENNPDDFAVLSSSNPTLLNSTFSDSNLTFFGKKANLTVKNFLHIGAQNMSGAPINADAEVSDNGQIVFDEPLGDDGIRQWLVVTDATYNSTGRHDNTTIVNVSYGQCQFDDNPRNADMGTSHWELFITDDVLPQVSNIFPVPDWPHNNQFPIISLWVTDNTGIVPSSVRLYVQSYSVFYDSEAVQGGYNISYYHAPGFMNGEVVECRIVASDVYGNQIDHSWNFVINLSVENLAIELETGWNLISIPFEPMNNSVESVLGSIMNSYDQVQAYDASDPADRWKTYSAHRPHLLNDLTELDTKVGFWVHITKNCTLLVSGVVEESTAIPLYAGWNLVGYPTLNETTLLGNALWGTGADKVEGFDADAPYRLIELGPPYIMTPGEAYWIRVPSDTIWIVDW